MASVRLPLAKPVQEMVIPEVGSREAKSMPMASKVCRQRIFFLGQSL